MFRHILEGMSLGDHIKNEILEDKPDPRSEVGMSAFWEITSSIIDTHSAIKVLAVTVTAEVAGFLIFYFAKDKVEEALYDAEINVWMYCGIGAFMVGFLTTFAAFRLVTNSRPKPGRGITIWLVSIAGGALNIILFYALLTLSIR